MVRLINSKLVDCFFACGCLAVNSSEKAALHCIATDRKLGREWQSQRDCTMQFIWVSRNCNYYFLCFEDVTVAVCLYRTAGE